MRTTVTLDPEVSAAVEQVQRAESVGVSEAVNRLIRRGLATAAPRRKRFEQGSVPLGLTVDVTNVAEALELLDGPAAR
jgi:hypothetical protein